MFNDGDGPKLGCGRDDPGTLISSFSVRNKEYFACSLPQ